MLMKRKWQQGFTMIELMIVVVVIAILAAIAIPAYQSSVIKSKRGVAASELLKVVGRQEQYFINNKGYATDLTDLGYGANPYYVSAESQESAAANSIYQISLSGATASSFTLVATPQNSQAGDSACGKFSITNSGVKQVSGTAGVSTCW